VIIICAVLGYPYVIWLTVQVIILPSPVFADNFEMPLTSFNLARFHS